MANMGIEVEIYKDSAPFDKIGVIEARQNPTILREIEAVGAGSFVVAKNNPKIVADPSLLDYRNFVRVRVNGVCQGGFILKNKEHVIVGEGEQQAEAWSISGEGLRSWGKDASVRPARGISLNSRETRYFNFAAEQGSWYNPAQWTPAVIVNPWGAASAAWRGTAPANWPDAPQANWIWDRGASSFPMPQGYVYFRYEINLAESGQYALFFAVDDAAELYVDGELIHTTDEHAWEETTRQDFDLDAGWHVFALKCYNYKSDGPGSLIGALYKVGDANSPTAARLLAVTDTSWKICAYPAVEPGWTPGNILLTLLSEAAARGVRFAQNWTTTFTNTHDSAGVPWGDNISISFNVGTNYEEVFEALEEVACDIYLDAETLQLHAWKKRGVDRSIENTTGEEPIILRVGHNLRTADEKGQADIVNTLLLKTKDGWQVVQPSTGTSVAKYGVLEGQISTDMTSSAASGLVDEVFTKKALPEKTATFELIPVPGMVPLEDFFEGDYVSAPGEVPGVLEKRRIMSISITENNIGDPVYAIEFDAIFSDRTDDLAKMLSKATHTSALGGGFTGSTGTPQTPTQGSNPTLPVASSPEAPTGLVVQTVGRWADNGTAVSDYGLTWNPVVSNINNLPVSDIESYEVWGRKSTDTNYALLATVFDSFAYLSGYNPGEDWYFQVRAISRTGGYGNFSEPQHLTADAPVVPLGQPSKPTLVTELGAVAIRWDGLIAGSAAPTRYKHMEIQRSNTQNGTYVAVGSFVTGSGTDSTGVVGNTYWYRLVPVDYLGVKGAASLPESIQVAGVSTSELDQAVNDAINGAQATADDALDKAVEALSDAALAVVSLVTEYATSSSESSAPSSGWSTTAPARTPGTFIWQRTTTTYGNDNVVTSSPVLLTGNTGSTGISIASQAVTYQVSASGTTAPTGTWTTTVPSVPQGQFLWARTITTLTDNTTTTTYSVSRAGADGATGSPGTAATNIVVGNDAVAFPVSAAGATLSAYTVTIPFGGWIGNARAAATVAVSGLPSGITAGTNTPATTSADGSLILNVANGSTLGGNNSGDITLTFTVNSLTFVRRFSWAKAFTGAQGSQGNPGADGKGITSTAITYQVSASGTTAPTGTWTTTVPTVPQGQFLWTRTIVTYTDTTTTTAYSVSRAGADGAQGTPGNPGADGQTSYLHVAYATNATGTAGFSTTDPTGKTYMGTYTDFTAADSTNPALYDWVLIKGADGSTGATGKGISSSVVTYQVSSSGTTAPTGTWVSSVPTVPEGQFLWTRTVLTFTDSATTTTYSVAKQGVSGSNGADGRGISSSDISYQVGSSGTTAPTGTWSSTVPSVPQGQFLWSRTVLTYTDSTTATSYAVSRAGADGAQGTPGTPGTNGQTSYLHVAYATAADGSTGFSTTDPSGKTYMGTYTDFTAADSNAPSAYEWVLIKGADGATGAPGKGISSAVVTYQASSSGTTAPTGTWVSSPPALTPGQYMWTRTVITFTDNATTTTYSVSQAGATGATGTSATSVDIGNEAVVIPATAAGATSAASTITIPFTGFIGTTRAAATVAVSGLPTGITVQTNTAGTTSAAGSLVLAVANGSTLGGAATGTITLTITVNGIAFVRLFTWTKGLTGAQGGTGNTGAPGKGVASVTPYYLLVTTGSGAPAAPTTNPPGGGWTLTEPAYVANTEMYRAELFVFTDATFGWTSVSKVASYTAATEAISLANLADAAAKGLVKAQSADPGQAVGRIWLQLDGSGRVIGIKISNGTAWSSYALMADQILVPSSLGTVTIKDGAISAAKMLIANLDNQLDNPNFQNNTFDGWVQTGSTAGWDTPTSTAAAINRYLRRVTGASASAAGQVTNGFRCEVRPGQRVRIDALSYNEGIAPGAWTEARRNLFPDPLATDTSATDIWGAPTQGTYSEIGDMTGGVSTAVRWTRTATGAAITHALIVGTSLTRGNVRVRASAAVTATIQARPAVASNTNAVTVASSVAIPAGVSEINVTGSAGTFTTTATSGIVLSLASGVGAVGVTLDITNIAIEALATSTGDVFNGGTTSTSDLLQYRWVGTPNASQSVAETRTAASSIGAQFYDNNGNALVYVPKALDSSGTWVPITYEIDVPDNAYAASLRVEDAGAANDTIRLANMQFRVMGAGQLLVDGTIQGRHVATETLESRNIKTFSIEVDRLSPTVGSSINLDGNTNINALASTAASQQDALTSQQQRIDSVADAVAEAAATASSAGSAAAAVQAQANGLQAGLATTQQSLEDLGRTYRFTSSGAFVGAPGSPYEFVIQNTGAEIRYNGSPVSSWDAGQMIVNSFVGNEVVLGNHKLEKDTATGGTVVRKIVSN